MIELSIDDVNEVGGFGLAADLVVIYALASIAYDFGRGFVDGFLSK